MQLDMVASDIRGTFLGSLSYYLGFYVRGPYFVTPILGPPQAASKWGQAAAVTGMLNLLKAIQSYLGTCFFLFRPVALNPKP